MHAVPGARMRAAGQAGLGHDGVCTLELDKYRSTLHAARLAPRDAHFQCSLAALLPEH